MSTLKKFILVGLILLVVAIITTIYVWMTLQNALIIEPERLPISDIATPSVTRGETMAPIVEDVEVESEEPEAPPEAVPEAVIVPDPVPVPLTDTQKSIAETVGIDTDTFVITPAMATCAEEKLGAARVAELIAGDTPSILETASLVGCIGAE